MILALSYTVAPLFLHSKNKTVESNSNTVVGVVRDVVQKIESALNPQNRCSAPFHYAIGTVDPRFGLGRENLKADMLQAESIWEDTAKEDLLQYDEQSAFKINLVFDDRQKKTLESKQLEQKLNTVQTLQQGISQEYDTLSNQYTKKKAQYESDVKKYERLSDDYDRQVTYWNDKGGAPENEYQQLQEQQKTLNALGAAIEKQRKNLNDMVDQLNILVKKEKKVVAGYNQDVATYESVYGGEKEFDQGVYTGKEINIYQYSEANDLVLVLAHELGHALGMDHVENSKSIMYYLMAKQDMRHTVPSAEDMQALRGRCS